jgi:hypothetical protein
MPDLNHSSKTQAAIPRCEELPNALSKKQVTFGARKGEQALPISVETVEQ